MTLTVLKNNSTKFVLFLILAVLFVWLGQVVSIDRESARNFLGRMPLVLSGFIFIVLYVVVSFFVWIGPKDIFKIVGALVYGPWGSSLLVYVAEMVNVIALFSLSRTLGRGFVEARLPRRMRGLDDTIADTRFLSIFFLRFFPLVPFRFLDLGFGLTRISLKKYLVISILASPLRIFIVQLFLSLGLETVMNPDRFAAYLLAHPHIFGLSFIYIIGSLAAVIFLKRRMAVKQGQEKASASDPSDTEDL